MSNEEFIKFFGYNREDFADENAISKRKNDAVDSLLRRAGKIKDAFNTIDGLKDWGNDPIGKDKDSSKKPSSKEEFELINKEDYSYKDEEDNDIRIKESLCEYR